MTISSAHCRVWRFVALTCVVASQPLGCRPAVEPRTTPGQQHLAAAADPATPVAAEVAPESSDANLSINELVVIPAGEPQLGEAGYDENPLRVAYLSGFRINRTEVTAGAYAACVASQGCPPYSAPVTFRIYREQQMEAVMAWMASHCNYGHPDRRRHPMNCVTRDEAAAYCAAQGQRLPTQEEWEYAGRGLDGRDHPWGDERATTGDFSNGSDQALKRNRDALGLDTTRWYAAYDDGFPGTAPVGSFRRDASPFGVLDLGGNVSEWTSTFQGELVLLRDSEDRRGHPVVAGTDWMSGRGFLVSMIAMPAESVYPWSGFRCAADIDP